ncbi:MAG: hypothetical protein KGJ57_16810 [Sphingomonadales bacterium]|nr:hypothetical protein [Sphingomonadales bacterium]MDE2171061.1 hypothetical protein [Sphingomonadales bacterium]
MKMKTLPKILLSGVSFCLFGAAAHGQGDMSRCSAIISPAARLACYDEMAGRPAAPPATHAQSRNPAPVRSAQPARPAPAVAPAAPVSPASDYAALRKRSNFTAVALKVEPLPHGLFRLHLADGTAYDTSMEGAHVASGMTLHIRRSPLGTTFVDLPGQAPIPVRLHRPG